MFSKLMSIAKTIKAIITVAIITMIALFCSSFQLGHVTL